MSEERRHVFFFSSSKIVQFCKLVLHDKDFCLALDNAKLLKLINCNHLNLCISIIRIFTGSVRQALSSLQRLKDRSREEEMDSRKRIKGFRIEKTENEYSRNVVGQKPVKHKEGKTTVKMGTR